MWKHTKCAMGLGVAGMIATANLAQAATNEQLEHRIDRLERLLQQTRAELHRNEKRAAKAEQAARQAETERTNAARRPAASKRQVSNGAPQQPTPGLRVGAHTRVRFGGYIKLDTLYSDYSGGTPSDAKREFYTPSRIPVGNASGSHAVDFNARQSRINLTSLTHIGGHKIKGFVETDFYGNKGSESVTNSNTVRLRHAYFEIDDRWLFGQTWSNFRDNKAAPETLDLIGPAESIVFIRQPQLRYTHGNIAVSVENPETLFDVDPGGTHAVSATPSDGLPEFTASYSLPTNFGHLGFGAVLKRVSNASLKDANGNDFAGDSALGYGLRFSGRVAVGHRKDDVRFSAIYGDGLGRYVGEGITPAGYVRGNGNVETIAYFASYVGFKHYWSPQWRSNLVLGTMQVDNNNARGATATQNANSIHANLLWNPLEPLTMGAEYIFANRAVENATQDHLNRLQLSAIYAY